jgi:tRNA nucleotidyltransferase (CCA-adding enzyme)
MRESFLGKQDKKMSDALVVLAKAVAELPQDLRYPAVKPRLLVVGGYVRDLIRGEMSKDVDVEVYGVSPAALAKFLLQRYPGCVKDVGKSFGIFKVMWGMGGDLDVALPRRERKVGVRHTDFVVDSDPGLSVGEALRRRDFTINAIAWDPLSDEVIDPYGGVGDIEAGVLRCVDVRTFVEDSLRVYRAVQFAARFGFVIEEKTFEVMKGMVEKGELGYLPAERVTDELRKMLMQSVHPSVGLELMEHLGILAKYYLELAVLRDTKQDVLWHPEGDVLTHTGMVVDNAAGLIRDGRIVLSDLEKEQVMLGALCHDLGKPATTKEVDGHIRSRGHEEKGREVAAEFLRKFTFGGDVIDAVLAVTAEHLKPGMLFRSLEKGELSEKQYAAAVRKLLRRVLPASWRVLVTVAEADYRGRGVSAEVGVAGVYSVADVGVEYKAGVKLAEVVAKAGLEETLKTTLVRGEDVMEIAARVGVVVSAGPKFGELIRTVEEMRDSGDVVTREEGLNKLEELIRKLV